ncbi:metallophosphoesterase family protein [Neobacillus sp. DY30]|uniref:metallophosphoesterase family protein n=1 Tax=Neobacillus sp. DY30 TaxID=3047871 RepID=UPI0024BFAAF5|nr:metallophosphoesterase family protein [Neobacillus sp. DY30]WHY03029.1 metallophosphoesterase family protein [Neobacillus sp. DY30]
MKIIVISDTHLPKRKKGLPVRLLEELKDVELIIHAGDWQTIDVYHELHRYGRVEGVYGNIDDAGIVGLLPSKLIVEAGGFRFGITHGHGKGKTTEKRAIAAFEGENVDCIIFGHSHIPVKRYEGDLLIFNPGSPTDKRRQKLFSFGVITVSDKITAEHIFFNEE